MPTRPTAASASICARSMPRASFSAARSAISGGPRQRQHRAATHLPLHRANDVHVLHPHGKATSVRKVQGQPPLLVARMREHDSIFAEMSDLARQTGSINLGRISRYRRSRGGRRGRAGMHRRWSWEPIPSAPGVPDLRQADCRALGTSWSCQWTLIPGRRDDRCIRALQSTLLAFVEPRRRSCHVRTALRHIRGRGIAGRWRAWECPCPARGCVQTSTGFARRLLLAPRCSC